MKNFLIFKWLRQAKAWVESYADKPYAEAALFVLAITEAVFFPLPPDALLIAMAFAFPRKSFRFALVCTAGSIVGALIGFGIGYWASDLGHQMIDFFDKNHVVFDDIQCLFDKYGFWGVLFAAITPIPFKIFTVASGIFHFDFVTFILASIVGRSFRFFAVASLFYFFGRRIKPFIDKYFEVLVVAFTVLLIGGVLLLKFLK